MGMGFSPRVHSCKRLALIVGAVALCSLACATTGQVPDRSALDAAIRSRAMSGIRVEGKEPLPPDASIEDGLTSQEAVSIALWNSPSFQATLTDLGLARADLVEAGLLRNPMFSLLFHRVVDVPGSASPGFAVAAECQPFRHMWQ
jgi:cobalt-zinc-cadmium efflux system outer membrane protein